MWTIWRIVRLVSVRRESGCVLAPQVVTQCVPAFAAVAGTARTASASAIASLRLHRLLPRSYGVVVDSVKTSVSAVGARAQRVGGVDRAA